MAKKKKKKHFLLLRQKKKVETLSTFETQENSLTNHIAQILSYDTNKHDIKHMQIEIPHTTDHSQ